MYNLNSIKRPIVRLLFLIFPIAGMAQNGAIPTQSVYQVWDKMEIRTLNGKWKFKYVADKQIPASLSSFTEPDFDDASWDYIAVPANWETEGFKTPQYGADTAESWGLYRTAFNADPTWKNRHTILRFDGVQFGYEVFVNGHYAGKWGG